jgi:flagellar L-ring protein precursor FlgH
MKMRFLQVVGFTLAACLGSTQVQAGSLYDPQTFKALSSDNKAFRVGDVLTVQVIENSSAVTSADTGTRRKNDINASYSGTGNNPNTVQAGVAVAGTFDGGGSTQRTNRLLATVSVTVQEILPNGEMRVAGEQLLTVNQEQQKVNLVGRVRPQDISDGNVVLSTRLADARITYEGEGDVSDRSKRGAWRRFVDWIGF